MTGRKPDLSYSKRGGKTVYKVRIQSNIMSEALEKLDSSKYEISENADTPDVIIVRSESLLEMDINPELLCIVRAGAGYNNIPIERCADEGVVVFNTPGANADSVKELVLCGLFLSSRDILGGLDWVRTEAAKSDEITKLVEKEKVRFVGPEVFGKTLGVIGLGAIGAKIAQAATTLGMRVFGYDPYLSVESAWKLSPDIIQASDLDTIYKNSDYVTIHIPYLNSTHHFISKKNIEKMKPGVRIINLSRAELVCDEDILAGLASGHVACYVTDFPTEKTAGAPGVIAIPHLGASTPESEENCVSMACSEVIEYVENGNICNAVNMANAYLPRTDDPRICIVHFNIPEMIAKITSKISSFGVNIENMLNASTKGSLYAYTMLDVSALPEGIEDAVCKINGVIRVRVIPQIM